MKHLTTLLIVFIFGVSLNAEMKKAAKAKETPKTKKVTKAANKKSDQETKTAYLRFCEVRVQKEKYTLKKAREICKCSMESIIKLGTMNDLYLLSKETPKKFSEKTEADRKKNEKMYELSNLEINSLDDCSRGVAKR